MEKGTFHAIVCNVIDKVIEDMSTDDNPHLSVFERLAHLYTIKQGLDKEIEK